MRVLIGIVIGADYPSATSMITEFSSTRQRAFSISFIAAMWYVGATCADLVGYWLYDVEGGWRWMLGSAAIPCLLILIGRFELPESPRWLLRKGRVKECEEMMIKLFGEPVAFDEEQPQQTRFRDLFNRRHFPFVLFVAAIWTCQVIPMFAIYTFGPQIVGLLGFEDGKNAALGNVVISLLYARLYSADAVVKHCRTASIVDWQLCHDDAGAGGFGANPGYGDLAGSDGLCGVCLFLWRAG